MRDLLRAKQPNCNSQFSVHFLIKAANIPRARVTPNLLTLLPHWRCTLHSLYITYDTSALRADRLDRLDIDVHARAYTRESTCAISEYRSFDSPQNCPSRRRPRRLSNRYLAVPAESIQDEQIAISLVPRMAWNLFQQNS